MSQSQALGTLRADGAHWLRLRIQSQGGKYKSFYQASGSSGVLKFLRFAYITNLRDPVLHTCPSDQSSTPSSYKSTWDSSFIFVDLGKVLITSPDNMVLLRGLPLPSLRQSSLTQDAGESFEPHLRPSFPW